MALGICFLPAYPPELQPAERLWPLTNEAIANRGSEDLEDLDAALVERCRRLDERLGLISVLTQYAWRPEATDEKYSGFGVIDESARREQPPSLPRRLDWVPIAPVMAVGVGSLLLPG